MMLRMEKMKGEDEGRRRGGGETSIEQGME